MMGVMVSKSNKHIFSNRVPFFSMPESDRSFPALHCLVNFDPDVIISDWTADAAAPLIGK